MKKALLLLTLALMVSGVGFAQTKARRATLLNKIEQMAKYNAQHSLKTVPTAAEKAKRAKNRADGTCTVTLTAGDVWGDGSGYQMLLDADATMIGATNGVASQALFDLCEYKIPENADFNVNTENIVLNNSITITIPAGTYDWIIFNPTPGDKYYRPYKGNIEGYAIGYEFEAGNAYEFTISQKSDGKDGVFLTINGEEPSKPAVFAYKRPAGSFFDANYYTDNQGVNYAYYYLMAPNAAPLTFENKTTDPTTTTWTYGDDELSEGTSGEAYVKDNNAVVTYYPIVGGYIDPLPVLHQGDATYTCADGTYYDENDVVLEMGQQCTYVTREMGLLSIADDVRGTRYFGYEAPTSTMPARFGFGGIYPMKYQGQSVYPYAIYQEFEKPAAPLYLEEVVMPCYTDKIDGAYTGIPEGKQLTMDIMTLDGDLLGRFYCTSKDITISGNAERQGVAIGYGSVEFMNVTEDEFGNEKLQGVVIDQPFCIIITGLNEEGVDVGFPLNDISDVKAEQPYQAPTVQYYIGSDGTLYPDYVGMPDDEDECYITMFYLYGIMDNVVVEKELEMDEGVFVSGYEWTRINETDENKIAYTDIPEEDYQLNYVLFRATQPWTTTEGEGEEAESYDNYEFIFNDGTGESYDAPDWLDCYMEDETRDGYYARTYLQFAANNSDLTQGNVIEVDGRRGRFCAVCVETLTGQSECAYVIQGDLTHEDVLKALGGEIVDGIQGVTVQKGSTLPSKKLYNLSGQRVNKNYRGIVIENGRKVFKR